MKNDFVVQIWNINTRRWNKVPGTESHTYGLAYARGIKDLWATARAEIVMSALSSYQTTEDQVRGRLITMKKLKRYLMHDPKITAFEDSSIDSVTSFPRHFRVLNTASKETWNIVWE